jgi:uncharacterized protein (DUF2062 family)
MLIAILQLPDRTSLEDEATKPNTDIAVVAASIALVCVVLIFARRAIIRSWHRRQHRRRRRRRRSTGSALIPPRNAVGPEGGE